MVTRALRRERLEERNAASLLVTALSNANLDDAYIRCQRVFHARRSDSRCCSWACGNAVVLREHHDRQGRRLGEV
jgi:hypothetical protein